MTALVDQKADVRTGSMSTDSIIGEDVKNTGSSADSDKLGVKDERDNTVTIIAVVLCWQRRQQTTYKLQLKS